MDDVLAYSIISAIIGAMVGGFFAIAGVVINNFIQYRKEKELKRYEEYISNYYKGMKFIDSIFTKFLKTGEPLDRKDIQEDYRQLMLFLLLVSPDKDVRNVGTLFNDPDKVSRELTVELFLSFRKEVFGKTNICKEEVMDWLKIYM